jgi:hypothetical protein
LQPRTWPHLNNSISPAQHISHQKQYISQTPLKILTLWPKNSLLERKVRRHLPSTESPATLSPGASYEGNSKTSLKNIPDLTVAKDLSFEEESPTQQCKSCCHAFSAVKFHLPVTIHERDSNDFIHRPKYPLSISPLLFLYYRWCSQNRDGVIASRMNVTLLHLSVSEYTLHTHGL